LITRSCALGESSAAGGCGRSGVLLVAVFSDEVAVLVAVTVVLVATGALLVAGVVVCALATAATAAKSPSARRQAEANERR